MPNREPIQDDILRSLHPIQLGIEKTRYEIPTFWISRDRVKDLLRHLKGKKDQPYSMLYDLTAIDERARGEAQRIPKSIQAIRNDEEPQSGDFTLVYHLLSLERASEIRVKVRLDEADLKAPSITDLWPSANWYEREAWDMFGIRFEGHPNLRRILLPPGWQGHPLRKEHPARATEMAPFQLPEEPKGHLEDEAQEALRFRPEEWGLKRASNGSDFLFLNLGPHHVGTHGVLRIILQLRGEEVLDSIPDIGYHHRAAEKMGERQTWHTFIPYTDRVDYLSGVMNNFPYVLAVEKLAGIEVPERARVIRIMLAELFRIASHLVWYGTFAQDVGALSPVFYMFSDRERIFEIVEAITGGRMHPSWFRIGGVAADLPENWAELVNRFLDHLPKRLDEYDAMVMKNRIFQARTRGVGAYSLKEAIEWGVTGPGLRACGLEWDLRKKRPYAGYDQFDFDIPTATKGDSYDRALVRVEEMRQSLRIIRQCVKNMPPGPVLASHPCAAPPPKEKTLKDIETLITHFLSVSWGPVIPEGEAHVAVEATKGINGYYLVSDGNTRPYRVRIRTPSFPHLQMLSLIGPGHRVADILAILGSMDYVLADVDR